MLDFENNITDYEDFEKLHLLNINEYRTVGSIIFIYITLMMVLHLPIIWIFVTKKEFYKNSSYILMTHLCIGNMVSLADWQTTCIMMIFPIKLNLGDAYGRILAAFDACDFVLPHLFMLALAIVRLVVICEISLPFNTNNKILCHTMSISIYLTYLVVFIMHILQDRSVETFHQIDEFVFDLNARRGYYQSNKNFLDLFIFYLQGIPIAISMVLYVLIVVKIIIMRGNKKLATQERGLLIQTMLPCLLRLIAQCFWNFCFIPGKSGQIFQLTLLCLDSGYDPIIFLCANRKLREQMGLMFSVKSTTIKSNLIVVYSRVQTSPKMSKIERFRSHPESKEPINKNMKMPYVKIFLSR